METTNSLIKGGFFAFFGIVFWPWSMEEMGYASPKWGRGVLFLANPDLADILGDMDLDFGDVYFQGFFGF